jgi:glucose/arabinose dehydrogenase
MERADLGLEGRAGNWWMNGHEFPWSGDLSVAQHGRAEYEERYVVRLQR